MRLTGAALSPMNITNSISRLIFYLKRNNLRATVTRVGVAVKRTLFSGRQVLFYCDLSTLRSAKTELPNFLTLERHTNAASLGQQDLEEMTNFWNPELTRRRMKERFELGASLWMIRVEGKLAGYGWTLPGRTVEPHYFPLAPGDVQFLDFHVFSKFRGRALDWFLMKQILHELAAEGFSRALGEAAEWNKASLASFGMTPFQRLGSAKKFHFFGRTFVVWSADEIANVKLANLTARVTGNGTKATSLADSQNDVSLKPLP